jgi:hypothetical protein
VLTLLAEELVQTVHLLPYILRLAHILVAYMTDIERCRTDDCEHQDKSRAPHKTMQEAILEYPGFGGTSQWAEVGPYHSSSRTSVRNLLTLPLHSA